MHKLSLILLILVCSHLIGCASDNDIAAEACATQQGVYIKYGRAVVCNTGVLLPLR